MADFQTEPNFVPIILGGDIGAYALGREFHEAYGVTSIALIQEVIGVIKHSRIFEHEAVESLHVDQVRSAVERIMLRNPGKTPLLITNSEACIPVLSEVRGHIEGAVTPTPDLSVIERTSDKFRFGELCREFGLDTPLTERIEFAGSATMPAPSALPFPVVAKPAFSPEYATFLNRGFKKVYFMERQEQLDELWAALRDAGFTGTFLVQELIGGDDTYMDSITLYIDSTGTPTLFGGANVLLEDHAPTMLGNPVAMITAPMDHLWERCANMLVSVGYRGFANFDIKRDPVTGRSLLFEVNPRIGRNSYYNCAAGVNPMRFCVEDLVGGQRLDPVRVTDEILYSLVPVRLLRRYIRDPKLLERTNALISAGRVFDPQRYGCDNAWRRMLDVRLTELNQYRKFKRYYPEPTETSF